MRVTIAGDCRVRAYPRIHTDPAQRRLADTDSWGGADGWFCGWTDRRQ
jgi:hypothetical protein